MNSLDWSIAQIQQKQCHYHLALKPFSQAYVRNVGPLPHEINGGLSNTSNKCVMFFKMRNLIISFCFRMCACFSQHSLVIFTAQQSFKNKSLSLAKINL